MSHKLTAQIVRYCDILLVLPLTREWIEMSILGFLSS